MSFVEIADVALRYAPQGGADLEAASVTTYLRGHKVLRFSELASALASHDARASKAPGQRSPVAYFE